MSDQTPQTALVPANSIEESLGLVNLGMGNLIPRFWTRLNRDDPKQANLIFRCIGEAGENVNKYLNKEIEVVNYLLSPAIWFDADSGEEQRSVVTRLVLSNGEIISTHSKGVLKNLLGLVQLVRDAPWNPPEVWELRREPLKGEKSWVIFHRLTGEKKPKTSR